MNCARTNGELSISFDNGEMHPIGDFPTVVISAPTSTNVRISMRAGDAEIADADNLEILAGGCSRIIANNVTDTFRLTTTGALALEMSGAEVAEIDASNGGHIRISETETACMPVLAGHPGWSATSSPARLKSISPNQPDHAGFRYAHGHHGRTRWNRDASNGRHSIGCTYVTGRCLAGKGFEWHHIGTCRSATRRPPPRGWRALERNRK